MSCEYARNHGYQSALRKFHDKVNEDLGAALEEARKYKSSQTEYWRAIGKQDILLEQLDLISKWISEE